MASFADDLADIARPRSMEFIAGMAEGNECGANAKRLARLIEAVESVSRDLALGSARPDNDRRHARERLRAAVAEARR